MIVMKFGGSSLASAARLEQVADLVLRSERTPCVVLSAMGDTTNALFAVCRARADGDAEAAQQAVDALFDQAALESALDALFDAVRPGVARIAAEDDEVVLRLEGGRVDVPDQVLFVTPEREIRPGLLLARTLLLAKLRAGVSAQERCRELAAVVGERQDYLRQGRVWLGGHGEGAGLGKGRPPPGA